MQVINLLNVIVIFIAVICVIRCLTSHSDNKYWVITLMLVILQGITGFMMDKVAMLSTKLNLVKEIGLLFQVSNWESLAL